MGADLCLASIFEPFFKIPTNSKITRLTAIRAPRRGPTGRPAVDIFETATTAAT